MKRMNPPTVGRQNRSKLIASHIIERLEKSPGQYFFIGRRTRSSWARAVKTYGKGKIEMTTRNNIGKEADIFLRSKA